MVIPKVQFVEVDGIRIAYRRQGTGPVLVLLHGVLVDSRSWRAQFEGLADQCDLVAWDGPVAACPAIPRKTGR